MQRGTVLITGASTGIGAAAALALARAGSDVHAGVRDPAAGERLVAAAPPGALTPIHLDITDPTAIDAARRALDTHCGERGLAGLVANAGIAVAGPLEFLPLDDLRRQLEVNVVGQLAVTQALLPLLRRARGRVVITGSDAGFLAVPLLGAYSISKSRSPRPERPQLADRLQSPEFGRSGRGAVGSPRLGAPRHASVLAKSWQKLSGLAAHNALRRDSFACAGRRVPERPPRAGRAKPGATVL